MHRLMHRCFCEPVDGYVEFSIGGVQKKHRHWIEVNKVIRITEHPDDLQGDNIYFGPAVRRKPEMGKEAIKCSHVCWVDWDLPDPISWILPPTVTVSSGHGFHYYWRLDEWCTNMPRLENVNKVLAKSVDADDCFDMARIMRLPGTINNKQDKPPTQCEILECVPSRVYSLRQLFLTSKVGSKTRRRITTGDQRGYRSRSERDWAIVTDLLLAEIDHQTVKLIFQVNPCGDKFREVGDRYLEHTLKRAQGTAREKTTQHSPEVLEKDDGYYVVQGDQVRRVSTFKLKPKMLLNGEGEDAIIADVIADGSTKTWEHEVFRVSDFSSRRALKKRLNMAEWIWTGSDHDIERLQMHLVAQLQEDGMPQAIGTPVTGWYEIDGEQYIVASNSVVDSSGRFYTGSDSPIAYLDPRRETPKLHLRNTTNPSTSMLREIARVLPKVNRPHVIWPILGWFMACAFKPRLERFGYRFPVLNIFGTKGSGKTSTILKIFQPMIGYAAERSYDANTTRFVSLTLLGSSNCIPVAFSEFRVASANDFTRYVLLAYDTGRDPRGKADQTTVDYPLLAPFSIDGEDMVEDPASMERVLAVRTVPAYIEEGTGANDAFDRLTVNDLGAIATPYYVYTMNFDLASALDQAEDALSTEFPQTLPARIRKNLTVAWLGILSFSSFMKSHGVYCHPRDGTGVLRNSLSNVYSIKLGRAPTEADTFVEVIINQCARGTQVFPNVVEDDILWFQLSPAFEWYIGQRARQRRDTLSRKAISTQLIELTREYVVSPKTCVVHGKQVTAYGIDLHKANKAGLDVPSDWARREFVVVL